MRYQIYLNKRVSRVINGLAEKENKKPATLCKELLETFVMSALKAAETTLLTGKEPTTIKTDEELLFL